MIEEASQRGLPIIAGIDTANQDARSLLKLATHVIGPTKVLKDLAGPGAGDAARAIKKLASEKEGLTVIATDGYRGSYGTQSGESKHLMATKCSVQDTTGAGQAYHAGYLAALLQGKDL